MQGGTLCLKDSQTWVSEKCAFPTQGEMTLFDDRYLHIRWLKQDVKVLNEWITLGITRADVIVKLEENGGGKLTPEAWKDIYFFVIKGQRELKTHKHTIGRERQEREKGGERKKGTQWSTQIL